MRGSADHWLLMHGTPLTPAVWDDVTACLTRSGTVFAPAITPAGDARDAQSALAARLTTEIARPAGRLHVAGHYFGGQVALDFTLLVPQQVATLTLVCSRDIPFPAFAAARLRGGAPVDADTALSRWFTPAELERGGPVISYARRCLQQADRKSWAAALDAIARYDRAGRTASIRIPVTLIAAELDQVAAPAAKSALAAACPGYPADPVRRRAHDPLHRPSRPGRAYPPRRRAMMAGFPATPLARWTVSFPIPGPREPRTRSLALPSSRELDRHRATSGRCERCEVHLMRSASETMIPSGPRM